MMMVSTRKILLGVLLVWSILTVFPLPASISYAQDSDPLVNLDACRFNAYTTRDDLIIGAVVLNFDTGAGCTQNLNSTFPMASVGKLFVLGAFYEAVAEGRYSFEDEMQFTNYYLMNGRSACLDDSQVGLVFTVGYLANIMISCSDNAATWMLMDYIGWDAVQAYIDRLGIAGIGEVIPYSEVDRLKLTFIDPRWADVPRSLASQYIRRRFTNGLVPTYFDSEPNYSREQIRDANQQYLDTYTYNTATPRALAEFMIQLRQDMQFGDATRQTVARWIFNTMLLTQRQYTTQYMPGTIYVGSKNGYDVGYRAEVNIMLDDLESGLPQAMNITVVRHRDVSAAGVPGRFDDTPVTDTLLAIAPKITERLYPTYNASFAPALVNDFRVRDVVLNTNNTLFPCYQNFLNYDYLFGVQQCWAGITSIDRTARDDLMGVGVIFRDLAFDAMRMTVIWTQPDGRPRSYQMARFDVDGTAMAWFEDVNLRGLWRVDVFYNLQPIYSQTFWVE